MSDLNHKYIYFLKNQLNKTNVSYSELSHKSGMPLHTIKRIFSGRRGLTLNEQDKILKALDLRDIDLLGSGLSESHIKLIDKIRRLSDVEAAVLVKLFN